MTWEQTIKEERKISYKQGARATAVENAKNFLKKSNLSSEMIAECCSLPLEEVLSLKKKLKTELSNASMA